MFDASLSCIPQLPTQRDHCEITLYIAMLSTELAFWQILIVTPQIVNNDNVDPYNFCDSLHVSDPYQETSLQRPLVDAFTPVLLSTSLVFFSVLIRGPRFPDY